MDKRLFLVVIGAILVFVLGLQLGYGQERRKTDLDAGEIGSKLDEILDNQDKMLEYFEEMKEELSVIKVRASR